MRVATVLLFLLLPHSFSNADQVTSTTTVLTEDFIVDAPGASSLKFEGTNEFDFSGDGVADQQLNYSLVVETSGGKPLIPAFDSNGDQTGDLALNFNLPTLVITYSVQGMTELPGADPAFSYSFVSADFLGVQVTLDENDELIFADQSVLTHYSDKSDSWFEFESYGHEAAGGIAMNNEFVFKASPVRGTQVLHSLHHSRFTVDVRAVPEPGIAGVSFALAIVLMKRRRGLCKSPVT